MNKVGIIGLFGVLCFQVVASAQQVVKDFNKEDADKFAQIVATREVARGNYVVCSRLLKEKQAMFKSMIGVLEKDHALKSAFSYTYDSDQLSLFQLSTNAVKKGEQPKRTLVKKFKNKEEAAPLVRLMLHRQRLEGQIIVLAQLAEEQRQDNARWDEHLRKTFSLAPSSQYQLKKVSDNKFQLILVEKKK